jgi:hypothetical protein
MSCDCGKRQLLPTDYVIKSLIDVHQKFCESWRFKYRKMFENFKTINSVHMDPSFINYENCKNSSANDDWMIINAKILRFVVNIAFVLLLYGSQ